jgi:hypothetical protein
VEKTAEEEKLRDYQNRVSDWIGNQGLVFQLRYARTSSANSLLKQLGSLFVRLAIILALVAGVGYVLLDKHFASDSYGEKISGKLESALGLDGIETKGFARSRGNGGFRGLTLEGGAGSFFYKATLEEFNAPFAYLTGITTDWNPDSVKMDRADFSLKAGGTATEMAEAFSGIRESYEGKGINDILIEDFSCDWGYSKLTYGRIANTRFKANLENGRWMVSLSGGTYQQNWLKEFDITEGRLVIDEDGIEVVTLKLVQGAGVMNLAGVIGGPMEKPEFSLSGKFEKLSLEKLIRPDGVTTREFVEGQISGDLAMSGSTNQAIQIKGTASLADDGSVTIRERWPILKAISIMDTQRTFRRILFSEGSFQFATKGGGLTVNGLNLVSSDTAKLEGRFTTSLPTQEQAAATLEITLTDGFTDGFSGDFTDTSAAQKLEDERMSLSEELTKRRKVDDLNLDRSFKTTDSRDGEALLSAKEIEGVQLREEMKVHRINGKLRLAIPASSFAENENLARLYPADETGWRWIDIPLNGSRFSNISEGANEKILEQARMRNTEGRREGE